MLSNLLGVLGFGQRIMCGGKPYVVVVRLAENLFVASEEGAKMPAPLCLARADIAQPQTPPPTGDDVVTPTPAGGGNGGSTDS